MVKKYKIFAGDVEFSYTSKELTDWRNHTLDERSELILFHEWKMNMEKMPVSILTTQRNYIGPSLLPKSEKMSERRPSHILSKSSSYVSIQRKLGAFYFVFLRSQTLKNGRSVNNQQISIFSLVTVLSFKKSAMNKQRKQA